MLYKMRCERGSGSEAIITVSTAPEIRATHVRKLTLRDLHLGAV